MAPYLENEDTFIHTYNAVVNIYNLSSSIQIYNVIQIIILGIKLLHNWPEQYGLFWSSADTIPIQTLQPFAESITQVTTWHFRRTNICL